MKNIYTWDAKPARRNLTVADIKAKKGKEKLTQVTANTADEAHAAGEASIDMLICDSKNVETVRKGNSELFLTAALVIPEYPTDSDLLRGAFKALAQGADAVMTARSMSIVSLLANEDIPVMRHLGLVPRKSTWVGGLIAVGKNADEAFDLFQKFKRLENAGAFSVEAEVIPGPVLSEISKRTSLITVSLGSGKGGDVTYLFMEDICGENAEAPKHAKSFGNIYKLREMIKEERIKSLKEFRKSSLDEKFPSDQETAKINDREFELFMEKLDT